MNRRQFLSRTTQTTLTAALLPYNQLFASHLHLSCNLYTWYSYYNREGKDFYADLDAGLSQVAACGVDGFEPALTSTEQVDQMAPLLEKHGLEMRSVYVNSKLHEKSESDKSIESVLQIVEHCKPLGTKIVVTNPSPLGWGNGENKTDEQLQNQAVALERLGNEIHNMGLTLAYHTHDSEFRAGAREFHHMMQSTNPRYVTFCLDVHWVFRGASNSNVALLDVMEMYGDRISELHIRQSRDALWTETFGEGDVDYAGVVQILKRKNIKPLLVLEQAVEEGTPQTMTALEAHRKSQAEVRNVFALLD